MKVNVSLLLTAVLAVFLQSCTENEPHQEKPEQVQFSFSLDENDPSNGRSGADEFPAGAELILTITDNSGKPVLTNHRIGIMNFGGGYITEPLEFDLGRYNVTDFLIASGSEILYAVPKKNTPLAPLVVRPLPYSFNVLKGKLTNVAMEVVSTKGYAPKDFGYAAFNIEVVNPLSVTVFTSKGGETKLASAEAFLYDAEDKLIKTYDLGAKVNLLSFKGDVDASYKLVVRKPGWTPFIRTFNYKDLVEELDNLSLNVLMWPAFTMKTDIVPTFEIEIGGKSGSITIDWGDGSVETSPLAYSEPLSHTYAGSGTYYITITGDLENITSVYEFYFLGKSTEINFEHLTSLRSLTLDFPAVLDLSQNAELTSLNLVATTEVEQLLLPSDHKIAFAILNGIGRLKTSHVDYVVNSLYTNAVAHNIRDGFFSVNEYTETPLPEHRPSPAATAHLIVLRDNYGWEVGSLNE